MSTWYVLVTPNTTCVFSRNTFQKVDMPFHKKVRFLDFRSIFGWYLFNICQYLTILVNICQYTVLRTCLPTLEAMAINMKSITFKHNSTNFDKLRPIFDFLFYDISIQICMLGWIRNGYDLLNTFINCHTHWIKLFFNAGHQ